ncbi:MULTISPECIES: mandelate racemase/muconate lactonizing enzyme family protein [Allobacillus]|uniref:Dipeptide epimerase n=1 Tax=Allobacillus salarius TaxID=1955272 RepID=A0A556P8I9_9BACI|nr:dipeptide epimerase [Allobacillus salarius]TSJ60704.1 dipeptide epimerase [Allobacillus salarius]
MRIQEIETYTVKIPLKKPFKTALRTVIEAESVYVKVTTDNGISGYGEAPPTHVITGDSLHSIDYAINQVYKPLLIGKSIDQLEEVMQILQQAMIRNTSAKAALDMAVYDCFAQQTGLPLYKLLGGYRDELETDYTVSVNEPSEMADDAQQYIEDGFNLLKIKVGKDEIAKDIERIKAIREKVGDQPTIRLDANQGWSVKEAIYAIRKMEDLNLNIELVEQPVKYHDLKGLKQVTEQTETLIMADEAVFTSIDARRVLEMGAADLINIKLMKAGGIHEALKINRLAEAFGVSCMVGSMIETKLGISAAAHFAASQPNITRFDFDAPLMLKEDLINGGVTYERNHIYFSKDAGLGIHSIHEQSSKREEQ